MSAAYNEGLIERCYHTLWEQHFSAKVGAGYSVFVPGKEEVHVGFDLGFAKAKKKYKMTGDAFFDWMKYVIAKPYIAGSEFLYAYFFQYKLIKPVSCLARIKDKATLNGLIDNFGYSVCDVAYRAKIDNVRNTYENGKKKRPFSQHEALCRLAKIKGSNVAYCTPRFVPPMPIPGIGCRKLTDLSTTFVDSKTPLYKDAETHYLYFQTMQGEKPAWCSEPVAARLLRELPTPVLISPVQLLKLMKTYYRMKDDVDEVDFNSTEIDDNDIRAETFSTYLDSMPSSTRIMRFWVKN